MTSPLTVRYENGGIHLPNLGLWLDPSTSQWGPERVFISHAHTDHVRRHREVILTEITAQCIRARTTCSWLEHCLPFDEPKKFSGAAPFAITLLPAGHILGSAMAWIEAGGESLLYTGDFKLRPGLTAELCAPRRADFLIMETTFGRPQYQFPPPQEVRETMEAFCRQTLAAGAMPVLLGYSLGKSQDLLAGLQGAALPIMLHDAARKFTHIYARFGCRFPPYDMLDLAAARGHVLIWPPGGRRAEFLCELGPLRTAVFTGWASEPSCVYRYGVNAAFPLSDHADFAELVEFVRVVAPRKVYTVHGFAADFAQSLRDLGMDAQALSEADQLALPLRVER